MVSDSDSSIRFRTWVEQWWGTVPHLKPYTREGYESLLRVHVFPRFGAIRLGEITPLDVRSWIVDLHSGGLSASRIRQAYYLLRQILQLAVDAGVLAKTPCVGVRLPRMVRREMRFLTAAEVHRIAEAIREPYPVLVYTLAYGGLRWGEAAALRRGRCDLDGSAIRVVESMSELSRGIHFGPTKTYQNRTVALPTFLVELLATHLAKRVGPEADALVFTAVQGGSLRRTEFAQWSWRPALHRAGIERIRVHDLRHTCVALLIAAGANPKAVQAHLGHSTIQVTFDRYGHLFPSAQYELAARLDRVFREGKAGGD